RCSTNGLSRFLLVANGCEAAHELGRNFVERTHELRDRGLHGAQELGEQLFAGRHRGQGLDTVHVKQGVGHGTALDHQLVVALCKLGEHLGRCDRIRTDGVHQGTSQLTGNAFERRTSHGTTHQRVLENTQVDARLTRSLAQYGYRSDVQTTVLGDNDRLSRRDLRGDFLDDYRFLFTIETHGLNTPSNDAREAPLRQPNAAHLVEFFELRKIFHGRRLRWTRIETRN